MAVEEAISHHWVDNCWLQTAVDKAVKSLSSSTEIRLPNWDFPKKMA
jgi:hypothetical protein